MKQYYVSYTTTQHPMDIESEEIEFEDNTPINRETIYFGIEDCFNRFSGNHVDKIISWSKIEE